MPVRRLFPLLLLLAGLCPVPAQARLDPRLAWRTLESAHFLVLYHDDQRELAARAAAIAEEVHGRLTQELRWEPARKTRLVLADVSDAPNGMATPMPFNRIVVYLAPPLEQPFAISDREEWLRIVITHEYSHILHLDTVHHLPAVLRGILGRFYFPNAWAPMWLIEGLATYEETRHSGGGRGRSSYAEMLLRTAVLDGRFPTLSQAGNFPDSWPGGNVPYIFGVKFYQYLVEKYGEALPGELSTLYGGRPLPFMVDSTARRAFDSSFRKEWLLWQRELRLDVEALQARLDAAGLTTLQPLTANGDENLFPSVSPDGGRIAWSASGADRVPSLLLANADGSEARVLLRRLALPAGAAIAWLPDGSGLLYAKLELDRYDNLRSDLYRYDLASGREDRLTDGLRAASPALAPAGDAIACTVAGADRSRLALLDGQGRFRHYLSAADDRRLYSTPRWSPDGSRIAVAVKTPDGRFPLLVLDRAGRELATLADAGAVNVSPAWSPDGRLVYFSSDRGGIYNIHAWNPADGSVRRLSNVSGGLFCPAPERDGRSLLVASYGARGFDLARFEPAGDGYPPLTNDFAPSPPPALAAPAPPVAASAGRYWPLTDLLPRYWLPWFGSDADGLQLGLLSSGTDAPGRHFWAATALYGTGSHRPAYSLLYQYDGLAPTLQLFASQQSLVQSDYYRLPGGGEADFWEERRSFGLDLLFPSSGLWARHYLVPGVRYERFAALEAPPAGLSAPPGGRLSGVRLAWRFGDAVRPGRAISPEDGRLVELALQHNFRGPGDYRLTKATGDWREFVELPSLPHHVLALHLFGGYADGDLLPQRAFQFGGDSLGDLLAGIDQEALPLRGYPANVIRGQRAALVGSEYRFPLYNIERGVGNGPVFFRRVHGALFAEAGTAFDRGGVDLGDFRAAAGTEGRLDLDLGYTLPVTLRLVFARGFGDDGEDQGYLALWFRF